MKLLVVSAALLALGACSAIPAIPGDNSHYVEGKSRYIWMPDGEGIPHLVDLLEPVDKTFRNSRNGANNQYWLFTRRNPTKAQILVFGNISSVYNSNYDANLPLKVIVHGWNNNGNSDMNPLITAAYLAVENVNVIVVDWSDLASTFYTTAADGVPSVGEYLGSFLVWLFKNAGGDWNNVHLIGHSLGAHVVGNAGREALSRPGRITGLDPAGPLWGGNDHALNKNDGQYVEAIHTDGGILGYFDPIGDADFYPNGGKNPQPGCWISTCSHGRATELFASSVAHNHFIGNQCSNILEASFVLCGGSQLHMGNSNLSKRGKGMFGLRTESSWPF